jgi:flagellar hook-associated protein 1 FlgK
LAAPKVGGVLASDPTRVGSDLLSNSERSASGQIGSTDSLSTSLSALETTLSDPNASISSSLGGFFGAVAAASAAPMDGVTRQQMVTAAQTLTSQIATASNNISAAQTESDQRIADYATQATQLAAQIASANKSLKTSPDPVLADKRDLAAKQLAGLVGGTARIDPDGQLRFVLGNGAVLVDGGHAASVVATPDATLNNHMRVDVVDGTHVSNVTSSLDGGSIAGQISFRDGTAAAAANRLDQLAYDIANQVNTVHRANAGEDGVTGRDFFVQPTSVSGAAKAMAVSSVITADPTKIALASAGMGPSDAGGAAALLTLRDQKVASGGTRTMSDESISLVADVGAQASAASNASSLAASRADALASMRDSISGVSTEDELAALNKLQTASQAATKFVSTVNDLLQDLINNL